MNETRYHIQIIETGEVILLRLEESKNLLLVDDVIEHVKDKYNLKKGSFRYVPGTPPTGFKQYQGLPISQVQVSDHGEVKNHGKFEMESKDPGNLY